MTRAALDPPPSAGRVSCGAGPERGSATLIQWAPFTTVQPYSEAWFPSPAPRTSASHSPWGTLARRGGRVQGVAVPEMMR